MDILIKNTQTNQTTEDQLFVVKTLLKLLGYVVMFWKHTWRRPNNNWNGQSQSILVRKVWGQRPPRTFSKLAGCK